MFARVRPTVFAVAFIFALATGCTISTPGGSTSSEPPSVRPDGGTVAAESDSPAAAIKATAPAALVGTWTAGRGGTTISYDAVTATSSPSNASGLAYQFAADGTFAKAYRDSNGGSCPMIVLGTESGTVAWGAASFVLHSDHGTSRMWSSCSPAAVSTAPMNEADLDRGEYAFRLDGADLVLTRATDDASARFHRSP